MPPRGAARPLTERRGGGLWPLGFIVAASGFAGLAYEVVWTRLLAVALGNESASVLGVVAGFFAGLAAGALILDGPIRRSVRPGAAYAALELCIGGWALASIWLLPAAGRAVPQWLGTDPPAAAHWAVAFALPALMLLPATAAMGGTLVALERLVAARAGSGVSAGVYGANTAGAMAGALGCVFVLMPALGLSRTLGVLAAVNLCCALGTLTLAGGAVAPEPPQARPKIDARLATSLFATGLLGVGFEIAAVRLAAQMLQDTVYSFASLLAAYLLGTAAGGLGFQRASRRWSVAPERMRAALLVTVATACVLTVAALPLIGRAARGGALNGGLLDGGAGELAVAALLFLLPAAAMGALFGQMAQSVRDARGSLGFALGVNALGGVLAPALVALLLVPALGAARALLAVSMGFLLLLPRARWSALAPVAVAAVLLLRPAPSLVRVPPGGALLATTEGAMAAASVVEDASGNRYLEVNGHFRMGGTGSARSDWRQAALPLLLHPEPQPAAGRALFLGVGTGATLWGAAHVPGVSPIGVELVPEVATLLPWFAEPPEPDAPPVPHLHLADARRYVAADRQAYDVIAADLFHPALDGSGALYTAEHFAAIRARLAPGGVFCQWLPLYQMDLPTLRAIVRSYLAVFPQGSAWLAHFSLQTPMLALIARADGPLRVDPQALARRMDEPAAASVLRRTGLSAPMDVLGLFVGDAAALAAFAGPGPRNTDDFPFVAMDARRNVAALAAQPARTLAAALAQIRPQAAAVLETAALPALGGRIQAYWRARDAFIAAGIALPPALSGRALMDAALPGLLQAVRESGEFEPAYQPLLSMGAALLAEDPPAGERLLSALNLAAPFRAEARAMLRAAP